MPVSVRIILLLFLFSLAWPCAAQNKELKGKVVEQGSGQPLPGVIVVSKDPSGKRLAYTVTRQNGTFSFSPGGNAEVLEISFVGYEKALIRQPFPDPVLIDLKESKEQLHAAVIKEHSVRVHGDTLSYLASAVRTASDKTMGDVLQRLPGIEVNRDGSIVFNGRPISKLYVEGRDLLRGDYNFATLNLEAKNLKSIDVYLNHQPVKALDGLVEEESAALNVNLEEMSKGRWSMTLDVGGGVSEEMPTAYDAGVLAGMISKEFATLNKLRLNDIGSLPRFNEMSSTIQIGEDRFNRYNVRSFTSLSTNKAPLADRYSALNHTMAVQTVDNITTGQYTTAGIAAKYSRNRLESTLVAEQKYNMGGQGEEVLFRDETKKEVQENYFSMAADITTNAPRHYIKEVLFVDAQGVGGAGSVIGNRLLNQEMSSRKLNINNIMNTRFRVRDGSAYGFRWYTQISRNEEGYSVLSDGRSQSVRSTVVYSALDGTGFSRARSGWTFDLLPGAYLIFRRFDSALTGLFPDTFNVFPMDNALAFYHICPRIGARISKDIQSFKISGDIRAGYHFYHFNYVGAGKDSFPELSGGISLRYSGRNVEAEVAWRHNNAAASDQSISSGLILRSHNSLWLGRLHPVRQPSDRFSLEARIQEPLTGIYFIMNGGIVAGSRFLPSRIVRDGYILNRESESLTPANSWNAGVSLSKGILFVRGKIDAGIDYSSTTTSLDQNGVIWDYRTHIWNAFTRFKISPIRELTLDYDGSLVRSVYDIGNSGAADPGYELRQEIKVSGFFLKRLELSLTGEHLLTAVDKSTQGLFLLDAAVSFSLGGQVSLWLKGINLIGGRTYKVLSMSPLLTSSLEYAIRPRTVLLGITWSI